MANRNTFTLSKYKKAFRSENPDTFQNATLNFDSCTFGDDERDYMLFEDIQGVNLSFKHVVWGSRYIKFHNVNLRKTQFLHTDLRPIMFTDCTWDEVKQGLSKRPYLLDEAQSKQESPEAVANLYRQLKQSFEDNRDFATAGRFHFSEKFVTEENPKTPRSMRFMLRWYRWLSGYGESLLNPVLWLIGGLLLCAFVFMVAGLEIKQRDFLVSQKIMAFNHWAYWDAKGAVHYYDFGSWWNMFGMAFAHSFKTILPFQEKFFVLSSAWGSVVSALWSILSPVLIVLLGTAIRQKVKR